MVPNVLQCTGRHSPPVKGRPAALVSSAGVRSSVLEGLRTSAQHCSLSDDGRQPVTVRSGRKTFRTPAR